MNRNVELSSAEGGPPLDAAPLALLRDYAALLGAEVEETDSTLMLDLPDSEAGFFRDRRLVVALTPEALAIHDDAEALVPGSDLLARLTTAIRARAGRRLHGLLEPTLSPSGAVTPLEVPLRGATASEARVSLSQLPVGQLLARVLVRTGATVEERLVRSGIVDLVHGKPVSVAIEEACEKAGRSDSFQAGGSSLPSFPPLPPSPLVRSLIGDLESRLAPDLAKQNADATRALAEELKRLDGYYGRLLAEADRELESADARKAIEREAAKRRAEEESRHALHAVVHPLLLREWAFPVERAEWTLRSETSAGAVAATRPLVGDGSWSMRCPGCGAVPTALGVCREAHVACAACSDPCKQCSETLCRTHGATACHLDNAPLCDKHRLACAVCERNACLEHTGTCAEGKHQACSACLTACAHCGMLACARHGVKTGAESPRGERWLCHRCTVPCEGGTNEPVGVDEVTGCASCERQVCERHQAVCAVDGKVHCSRHLRRADVSRRLLCEKHRATCVMEPGEIVASDEVVKCATCAGEICATHRGRCAADGAEHCKSHLASLADQPGQFACQAHHVKCHVDGAAWSIGGAPACPVCLRPACARHSRECGSCGRLICKGELGGADTKCLTCRKLAADPDPEERLITAVLQANGGEPPKAKGWRTARDGTHTVVELDLGWTRKLVVAVKHGESKADVGLRRAVWGRARL